MADRVLPLDSVRTDGWFERIGETIPSFQALCDIIGARFFAFAMITGARITSLTVDRRMPDNTLIEFGLSEGDGPAATTSTQSVTLAEFRRRLVAALVQDEPEYPAPNDASDAEALQRYVGPRYLLLAPLYGYSLRSVALHESGGSLQIVHNGMEEEYPLSALRARLRTHVRQELERVSRSQNQGSIDLGRVGEAEDAAESGQWSRVVELLGSWPAPLAIYLRTPEGQMLSPEARAAVAKGLGLLGSACVEFREFDKAEEILRLGVQYAGETSGAGDVYLRLGQALLAHGRAGEAIAPLRRAAAIGADPRRLWPSLAQAFLERGRVLAALASTIAGSRDVAPSERLFQLRTEIGDRLGEHLQRWAEAVGDPDPGVSTARGRTTLPPAESVADSASDCSD
jgi:tetratricopeptide (TPR) repeat protein